MTRTHRVGLIRNGTGRVVSATAQPGAEDGLKSRVRATQAEVNRYLRTTGTRRHRLLNLSIVAGAIATALTAAPALRCRTRAQSCPVAHRERSRGLRPGSRRRAHCVCA
jgi:hypothetical protein